MITKILWRIYSNFLYAYLSNHAFNTELLSISMDYSIQNKGTESETASKNPKHVASPLSLKVLSSLGSLRVRNNLKYVSFLKKDLILFSYYHITSTQKKIRQRRFWT